MKDTVTLIQPQYVKKFKCNGKFCNAECCRTLWAIEVDEETFEKYKKVESSEKELTSKLKYDEERKCHVVQFEEKDYCPFLTEENLCGIQKKYGENFLSSICGSYPRNMVNIGKVYENALSLTCPLAAELALTSPTAMLPEVYKIPSPQNSILTKNIPLEVQPYFHLIQIASIVILKRINLTIDQRLIVLGFFWNDVEKLVQDKRFAEIEKLANYLMSPNFLIKNGTKIFSKVTFNHQNFLDVMIDGVLKNLYLYDEQDYIILKNFFMPTINGSENISMEQAEQNFDFWEYKRGAFLRELDTIFSNYVAHEIFYTLYPYHVEGSIPHNFATLVAVYKVVEMHTLAMNFSKIELKKVINCISEISKLIDNNNDFLKKISSAVEGMEDIEEIISTFLHT